MRCNEIRKLVSPYVDDALDLDMTRIVSLHLKSCGSCASYYNEVRAASSIMKRAFKVERDTALEARMFAGLEAAVAAPTLWERIVQAFAQNWRYAAAGSVFVLSLFISSMGGAGQVAQYAGAYASVSTKVIVDEYNDSASFVSNVFEKGKAFLTGVSRDLLGESQDGDAAASQNGGLGEGEATGSATLQSGGCLA